MRIYRIIEHKYANGTSEFTPQYRDDNGRYLIPNDPLANDNGLSDWSYMTEWVKDILTKMRYDTKLNAEQKILMDSGMVEEIIHPYEFPKNKNDDK